MRFPTHLQRTTMNDPTPTQPGAPFAGGFYGGHIRIAEAIFAIVWAPKAEGETTGAWLGKYDDVPGARSTFDGMANTVAMAEASSAIGNWARGLSIGGHTDWCVPARDVLELGYRLLKPTTEENACSFRDGDNAASVPPGFPYADDDPVQTLATAFQSGGAEAFEPSWYWSSTQYSHDYAARPATARSSRPEFAPSA